MDSIDGQAFELVTESARLQEICAAWNSDVPLALDTEFIRINTFYPRVGLFQIAGAGRISLVDPLTILSWGEFKQLLADRTPTVILHSCSEDLNLLQYFLQTLPGNLFDTQRAAAYLGYGLSISYQALVQGELGIAVAKDETRSDWLARPLSQQQLNYAALDVAYLHDLHQRLRDKMAAQDKLAWFEEDCHQILASVVDDESELLWANYYQSVGGAWRLNQEQLIQLQRLCYWREKTARQRNKPRSWILKDAELLSLALRAGKQKLHLEDVAACTSLKGNYLERDGQSLIQFLYSDYFPSILADPAAFSRPLAPSSRDLLKQCQAVVARLGEQLGIAPEILARKRQLVELIQGSLDGFDNPWPRDLEGWRRDYLEDAFGRILSLP